MGVEGGAMSRQYSKSISPRSAVGLIVGVVIGSGIFSSPGFVTRYVRSPGATLLVWFASGILSLFGGVCYSELGAALPFTGGETVYFERSFGRLTAFLYVWVSTTVARPASVALSAIVFSDYACSLHFENGTLPEYIRTSTAIGGIVFLCMVQTMSTYVGAVGLSALTVLKMILVASICVLGIYFVLFRHEDSTAHQLEISESFKNMSESPGDWVLAFANCLYAYNGWNMLNLTAAEVRDPSKTIPHAIKLGLLIAMTSFVWINLSYLITLPIDTISQSQTVAVDFARVILGDIGAKVVTVGVALSAFSTCHGSLLAGAQAIRESGRSHVLPKFFAGQLQLCSDRTPTPVAALIIQTVVASMLIGFLEDFEAIVRVYVWTQWIFYSLAIMALVTLRWVEPELERPYRVWLVIPVIFVALSVFMVFVLFFVSPGTCSIALVALLLGVPVYWVHNAYNNNQHNARTSHASDNGYASGQTPLLLTTTISLEDADKDTIEMSTREVGYASGDD